MSTVRDNTVVMRLALGAALLFGILLIMYLAWEGTRRQAPASTAEQAGQVADEGTGSGIGVADRIGQAGQEPLTTSPPAAPQTDPEPDADETLSPRAALYEAMELEGLRLELEADISDRMARRELRKQALRAPIGTSRFTFTEEDLARQGARAKDPDPARPTVASALPGLAPARVPDPAAAALDAEESRAAPGQAGQGAQALEAAQASKDIGYSPHRIVPARSPYELRKGTVIPGVLSTGVNSDIPGYVSGTVRLNVHDTVTGRYLLIPAGSRVFGYYDPGTTYGQKRLEVVWTHLMFPDGDAIVLDGQQATDGAGQSGFRDRRKGNFLRTLGGNLLYSILDAGEQAAQLRIEEAITGALPERDGLGAAVDRLGRGLSGGSGSSSAAAIFNRQQSQLKPTLIIRPGYPFNILVARDLILEPRE